MNRRLLGCLLLAGQSLFALLAQERCGHQQYMAQWFGPLPAAGGERQTEHHTLDNQAIITIPVVFHVVYRTAAENIADSQLAEQLQVLNEDFRRQNAEYVSLPQAWKSLAADAGIAFCLATQTPDGQPTNGINRVQTGTALFGTNNTVKSATTGGTAPWNTSHYLNIWVCNLGGFVFGYAPMPGGNPAHDGVVLDYRAVGVTGTQAPANQGRTATHEIGHWLGLRHIWGDDAACDSSDWVADTPNQASSSSGCPTFPKTDACSAASPGVMFQNYMDYTHDNCMGLFTTGQVARMRALFDPVNGLRRELATSNGCQTVGIREQDEPQGRFWHDSGTGKIVLWLPFEGWATLTVVDAAGRKVWETALGWVKQGEKVVCPYPHLPNGCYGLRVYTGSQYWAARMVLTGL